MSSVSSSLLRKLKAWLPQRSIRQTCKTLKTCSRQSREEKRQPLTNKKYTDGTLGVRRVGTNIPSAETENATSNEQNQLSGEYMQHHVD